jgi:DNA-binding HxlR family transcriptional regulator
MQVNKNYNMRSDCPVSYALDFFGDKWTFLIIRDLAEGKRFYKEFQGSKEKIATNILSDRLKKLEANGIVTSKVFEKLKTKKEYTLTQKGLDLMPVMIEMIIWSSKYHNELSVTDEFLDLAVNDREALVTRIVEGLDKNKK